MNATVVIKVHKKYKIFNRYFCLNKYRRRKKPRWSDQIVNLAFIVGLSLTCAPYTFCLRSPLTVHNRSQNSLQRSDNFQSQFCSSFAHHSISVHSRVCGCRLFRDFKWLISKYSTFPYMRLENFYYLFFTAVKDLLIYL